MATVQKTLRLSEATIQTINEFSGDTFTAKFETLVGYVGENRKSLEASYDYWNKKRMACVRECSDLQNVLEKKKRLSLQLTFIENELYKARDTCDLYSNGVYEILSDQTQLYDKQGAVAAPSRKPCK